MKKLILTQSFLFLILFLVACGDDDKPVEPEPEPIAAFTYEAEGGDITKIPATIKFTNQSKHSEGYTWTFGDNLLGDGMSSDTETNPTFTYSKSGTYTVKLVAIGTNSKEDTKSQDITVGRKTEFDVSIKEDDPYSFSNALRITCSWDITKQSGHINSVQLTLARDAEFKDLVDPTFGETGTYKKSMLISDSDFKISSNYTFSGLFPETEYHVKIETYNTGSISAGVVDEGKTLKHRTGTVPTLTGEYLVSGEQGGLIKLTSEDIRDYDPIDSWYAIDKDTKEKVLLSGSPSYKSIQDHFYRMPGRTVDYTREIQFNGDDQIYSSILVRDVTVPNAVTSLRLSGPQLTAATLYSGDQNIKITNPVVSDDGSNNHYEISVTLVSENDNTDSYTEKFHINKKTENSFIGHYEFTADPNINETPSGNYVRIIKTNPGSISKLYHLPSLSKINSILHIYKEDDTHIYARLDGTFVFDESEGDTEALTQYTGVFKIEK